MLLAALGVGVAFSGVDELRRRRALYAQQTALSDLLLGSPKYVEAAVNTAIEGDKEASAETERILTTLDLQTPTVPYDREMSKTLIQCSRLATEQYLTGKFDLKFDGSIQSLPTYSDRLKGYTQATSIKGPEEVGAQETIELDQSQPNAPLLDNVNRVKGFARGLASQTAVVKWSYPVYWGFLLSHPSHHILVLRGTQRSYEWLQTVRASQVTAQDVSAFSFQGAIHKGFATIYDQLSKSIITAVQALDPALPLFVSGHSLGAPLAALAALDIAQRVPTFKDQLRLYTYASPKLGNPKFAEAHSRLIPNSYRIANLADSVTLLPPTSAGGFTYVHLGELWAFINSTGDIGPSHFVSGYRAAIDAKQENQRN
jgi:triacylglycerol lipase